MSQSRKSDVPEYSARRFLFVHDQITPFLIEGAEQEQTQKWIRYFQLPQSSKDKIENMFRHVETRNRGFIPLSNRPLGDDEIQPVRRIELS